MSLDPTDPTPLIIDKISSYPINSKRFQVFKSLTGNLNNTGDAGGSFLDSLSRESYKALQRFTKVSLYLQKGGGVGTNNNFIAKVGFPEQGKLANNMQSHVPYVGKALQPISDAIGSHSDVFSSTNKGPQGPTQFLPQHVYSSINNIHPSLTNVVDIAYKEIQKSSFLFTPGKESGSLRQLLTLNMPWMNAPFELITATFMGLQALMRAISKLLDTILNFVFQIIYRILGFTDGLARFLNLVAGYLKSIWNLANMIKDMFDINSGCKGTRQTSLDLLNNNDPSCGMQTFGSFTQNNNNKFLKNNSNVSTNSFSFGKVGNLIGNILNSSSNFGSFPLNGNQIKISSTIFDLNLGEIFTTLLQNLHSHNCFGRTCNRGYSVGNALDMLQSIAHSTANQLWPTHQTIFADKFNVKNTNPLSYAREPYDGSFENLSYASRGQGNKGVIMRGPGSTKNLKVFRI